MQFYTHELTFNGPEGFGYKKGQRYRVIISPGDGWLVVPCDIRNCPMEYGNWEALQKDWYSEEKTDWQI